ncbi:hypothetical protein PV797_13870 [Clostridiaceae bacterium M8S5]|nr:hypothetical protein PV797_13870 [Clostridiaceae bacterium M8S5]
MLTIMKNSIRAKIRNKTIFIVSGIGIGIILLLALSGSFSYKGRMMVTFNEVIPVLIVMVSFIASILAVTLSLVTIPKEIDNKTHHLVLIRGVKPHEYALELALSNMIMSIICLGILYTSIIVFNIVRGSEIYLHRHIIAFIIMAVNTVTISAIVSLFSIKFSLTINGLLSIVIYLLGSFHNMLAIYVKTLDGFGGTVLRGLLYIVPDLYTVNKQVGLYITGKTVQTSPIIYQLLFAYIVLTLLLVNFRKKVY